MKKLKWINKRFFIQTFISILLGYVLSSSIFYFSGVYLLPDKKMIAIVYLITIFVFSIVVNHKINKMSFKVSKKDKKLTSDNINMDWTK